MAEHNLVGKKGEAIALKFLKDKNYKILHCNWRYQRAEIDIIAQTADTIAIVEVKTRTSNEFENPKDAVTIGKQKHLVRAAYAYIQENEIDLECRFDIISVLLKGNEIEIEHLEDAFYPLL